MKKLIIQSTFLFLLCFTACENDVQQSTSVHYTTENGYGRVVINVSSIGIFNEYTSQKRTVYPEMNFEKYEFVFSKIIDYVIADTLEPKETTCSDTFVFDLEVGRWQVSVTAFVKVADSEPAATGISLFTLTNGTEAVKVNVQLDGIAATGNGSFSYFITYPADAKVTLFTLEKLPADNTVFINFVDEEDVGSNKILQGTIDNIPAGYYFLTLLLENVWTEETGVNEVVYIYDKLDSFFGTVYEPIIFTNENFLDAKFVYYLTATAVSSSSIVLNWNSAPNADGYKIYRSRSDIGIFTEIGNSVTTSYTDISLTANTTYYYKVTAYNYKGTSFQSNIANVTTSLITPTGITTTAFPNSIRINWSSVTGANGYTIYRSDNTDSKFEDIGTSTTTSFTDTKPIINTTYYYRIIAFNNNTKSLLSDIISITYTSEILFIFNEVSAGSSHTVAIKKDGTLWAWGYNYNGQLGDGTTIDRHSPVQIGVDNSWSSVSAGSNHTVAIKKDGTLWAWTYFWSAPGVSIPLGILYSPVQIGADNNWSSVSAGQNHAVAIKKDGTLWAWGSNWVGQLGDGTAGTSRYSPVQIGVENNWSSVSANSSNHTVAIKKDGTLWAWGRNEYGRLGDGTTIDRHSPVQIEMDVNWSSVSAGYNHTVAIKKDGTLWAWGRNEYGQLGNGTTTDRHSSVQIEMDVNWSSVSAGHNHAVAIKKDGTLWAWGRNEYGRLGDGTTTSRYSPVLVP